MASILILILMRHITTTATSWTLKSGLIRTDEQIASGVFNGTIFLIGGYWNPRQMTKYRINSQQFIDLGSDVVDDDFKGAGQYWTQQQHIIYATNHDQFNIYNMETNEYIGNWKGITLNETTCNIYRCVACLASTQNYLFVTGGTDTLQILSLSSFEWISNAPPMNIARGEHACITNNDYLFVFGGVTDGGFRTDLNERIRISDITQNSWHNVDPLTLNLYRLGAASLADRIYIIGGVGGTTSTGSMVQRIVHVMNANTGFIDIFPDELPLANADGSPIIVDGVLFVMGGFVGVIDNRYYAYYPISEPTSPPTLEPTTEPTLEPTIDPSFYPTADPTEDPSPSPTDSPTVAPTLSPTYEAQKCFLGMQCENTVSCCPKGSSSKKLGISCSCRNKISDNKKISFCCLKIEESGCVKNRDCCHPESKCIDGVCLRTNTKNIKNKKKCKHCG